MNKLSILMTAAILTSTAYSNPSEIPASQQTPSPAQISVKEMMVAGHSDLKLHSLSMISKGKLKEPVDESYFPSFKACSEDPAVPVRSLAARLIGEHLVEGNDSPAPDAVRLLMKLAKDESPEVQHNAAFYGLTEVDEKTASIIEQLLIIATQTRDRALYEKIAQSLENDRDQVKLILDRKLKEKGSAPFHAIYAAMSGEKPPKLDKTLDATTIQIEEILSTGSSKVRLHALAMISQNKLKGGVNKKHLPGLIACTKDPALPVRSAAVRVIGQQLIANKENPNMEAVLLLMQLAKDGSSDVRFSAVYYGLTQIKNMPDDTVDLLLETAAANRDSALYDRIAESLKGSTPKVAQILDQKMVSETSIDAFEIYFDMTGKAPIANSNMLDLPTSRPKLFAFKAGGEDAEAFRAELEQELKAIGIENPDLFISDSGNGYVLLLKTYITRDRLAVEEKMATHDRFKIMQQMWLSPETEVQIEALRNNKQ